MQINVPFPLQSLVLKKVQNPPSLHKESFTEACVYPSTCKCVEVSAKACFGQKKWPLLLNLTQCRGRPRINHVSLANISQCHKFIYICHLNSFRSCWSIDSWHSLYFCLQGFCGFSVWESCGLPVDAAVTVHFSSSPFDGSITTIFLLILSLCTCSTLVLSCLSRE